MYHFWQRTHCVLMCPKWWSKICSLIWPRLLVSFWQRIHRKTWDFESGLKNILGHSAAPLKYLLLEAYHCWGIFQRFVLCFIDDVKTINLRLWIGFWKIFLVIWQLLWSIFFVRLTIIEKFSKDWSFASSMMSNRSITASVFYCRCHYICCRR